MAVAISLHNLRGIAQLDENRTKEEFLRSGGMINWPVNFSKKKSCAACVVGRDLSMLAPQLSRSHGGGPIIFSQSTVPDCNRLVTQQEAFWKG